MGEILVSITKVFHFQHLDKVNIQLISFKTPKGKITNSDLKSTALLLLWPKMEEVCPTLYETNVLRFSDSQSMVAWVQKFASRKLCIASQVVQALALSLNMHHSCPILMLQIACKENFISERWYPDCNCKNEHKLLKLFNSKFDLSSQTS